MTENHFAATFWWRNADPEQVFQHLWDLHCQLSLATALLKDRDEAYDMATDTSRRCVADAEALLRLKPGETFKPAEQEVVA